MLGAQCCNTWYETFHQLSATLLWHINFNLADINECQDGNNGGCTDQCTNTRGSYQCSCRRGYEFRREDEAPGSGTGGVDMTVYPITDAGRPCQGVIYFLFLLRITDFQADAYMQFTTVA